jgi:hypothetical protein
MAESPSARPMVQADQVGGKPPRVRHACKGMTPDQRWAFFSAGGKGRELFPAPVCDHQLYELAKRRANAVEMRQRVAARDGALAEFVAEQRRDSPSVRRRFFASDTALRLWGRRDCEAEMVRLMDQRDCLAGAVPSEPWLHAADDWGEEFPPGRSEQDAPAHASRMVLSVVSGRYIPPNNLSDEDRLDQLTPGEALDYKAPGSCGSVVGIHRL